MKGDAWQLSYDENLVRIQPKGDSDVTKGLSFGTLKITGNPETFMGKEIVFHTPSDHQIAGKSFAMEIQAIYEPQDKMSKEKSIVSFLFEKEPGKVSDFINKLDLTRIPNVVNKDQSFLAKGEESTKLSDLWEYPDDKLHYAEDFSYFHYSGSMTYPSCHEVVNWFLVKDIFQIGTAYLTMLNNALVDLPPLTEDSNMNDSYMNLNADGTNRIVQPIGKRQVSYHEGCSPPQKQEGGHYESLEGEA